jgi:N4-(beta-N-acetylglucosaminyl)-L-asparaginase
MTQPLTRRHFLASGLATLGASAAIGASPIRPPGAGRPVIISSANGLKSLDAAYKLLEQGADPLDAAIAVVAVAEADPEDHTVGLGGIPNEDGIVELDAAVMHGPTHGGGAVASLRNILHPAAVARLVMTRTDHCLLVGEGAYRFARMHGFPHTDLLTDDTRAFWRYWKETASKHDDLIPPPPDQLDPKIKKFFGPDYIREHGTIHCSALDTHGNLGCTTSTSGLYFKIAGRVGDSPILGAGLWLDNEAGSAGSTGRGEANLLNLSSHTIVEALRRGSHPKDAALEACRRIVATNKLERLQDDKGRPNFNVRFYCLAKTGDFAGASLYAGQKMAIHDGQGPRVVDCTPLFEEELVETL